MYQLRDVINRRNIMKWNGCSIGLHLLHFRRKLNFDKPNSIPITNWYLQWTVVQSVANSLNCSKPAEMARSICAKFHKQKSFSILKCMVFHTNGKTHGGIAIVILDIRHHTLNGYKSERIEAHEHFGPLNICHISIACQNIVLQHSVRIPS